MPITYRIDKALRTTFVKASGDVTAEDLIDRYDIARADPDFDKSFNTYLDFSELKPSHTMDLDKLEMTKGHIHATQETRDLCKWAFYAHEGYAYSFCQMFSLIAKDLVVDVKVFKDENEAKAWLGIDGA